MFCSIDAMLDGIININLKVKFYTVLNSISVFFY